MSRALAHHNNVEVINPGDVARLQRTPSQRIVIVEKQRTAGSTFWVVLGVVLCFTMLFSFLAWAMRLMAEQSDKALQAAEKQSQRSHDLAMKAVDVVQQTSTMNEGGVAFIGVLLGIAVVCFLVSISKGG